MYNMLWNVLLIYQKDSGIIEVKEWNVKVKITWTEIKIFKKSHSKIKMNTSASNRYSAYINMDEAPLCIEMNTLTQK